jgi:predicted nucleotide-binding protein
MQGLLPVRVKLLMPLPWRHSYEVADLIYVFSSLRTHQPERRYCLVKIYGYTVASTNYLSTVEKLVGFIGEIDNLKKHRWNDPKVEAWKNKVLRFLKREFGEDSDNYKEFEEIVHGFIGIVQGTPDSVFQTDYIKDLEKYKVHLESFLEDIKENSIKQVEALTRNSDIESKTLFIIHGHDEINTLKLQLLLKDRWNLNAILLKDKPGKGRTIIEKFEEEAKTAEYAFAILTPDDVVMGDNEYRQSRPNVFFELGWFYGRIGRENVCILFREGTKIHSDLDGISRIHFDKNISDKILEIESELKEASLI